MPGTPLLDPSRPGPHRTWGLGSPKTLWVLGTEAASSSVAASVEVRGQATGLRAFSLGGLKVRNRNDGFGKMPKFGVLFRLRLRFKASVCLTILLVPGLVRLVASGLPSIDKTIIV